MRFDDICLESVRGGQVKSDDLSIDSGTLRMQAQVAAEAGYLQLASNLSRAAELVRIPNERLLEIYQALRPHHSTYVDLLTISIELEKDYEAPENARFIREAAKAYRDSGLLRSSEAPRSNP